MAEIYTSETTADDIPAITQIVSATGLFPPELVSDMLGPALAGETTEFWRTARIGSDVVGFCYTAPEMLAEGTWNMLAIAVAPSHQGSGVGGALVADVEQVLRNQGQRLLLVDTSSTEDFAQTREFYVKNGYDEEARIRDFWAQGDDKVVFRKAL